ncbi:unnamed protein product [Leuciscus chuanchicus]
MADFDLDAFVGSPSVEKLCKCRKEDLLYIAAHYKIAVSKQLRKLEIRSAVSLGLVQLGVLTLSAGVGEVAAEADGRFGEEERSETAEEEVSEAKAVLPPSDPFSPGSDGSGSGARLKVRLARVQVEARERAESRRLEADLKFRLEIRRLEIEADTQIKLRELEIAAKRTPAPVIPPMHSRSADAGSTGNTFECFVLKRKQSNSVPKSAGFVKLVDSVETERNDKPDSSYAPFLLEGLISFLLTIMCTATRFPEAIPLRKITAPVVTRALVKFFSTFGLPKVVQSDQGTNFLSKIFTQVLSSLNITHRIASAYHAESQGALERFHQTFKSMLRKYCMETNKEWDEGVPLLLFAIREAVQESLGFSPAELVFGHTVRGPLKMLKEDLMSFESSPSLNVLDYVSKFRERLHKACSVAKESLEVAQRKMKCLFDRKSVQRSFNKGDKVLVLLPMVGSALSARFSGPYEVVRKISNTDYVIGTPDRKRKTRVCHVNMLKTFYCRGAVQPDVSPAEETAVPMSSPASVSVACAAAELADPEDGVIICHTHQQCARLKNSEVMSDLTSFISHLTEQQGCDIVQLINDFPASLNDVPSRTTVLEHDINVGDAVPIKQHAYRMNSVKRDLVRKEVEYLLEHGLAQASCSPWSSPCLLVPKSDGTARFCTDYRKVNALTVPDCFPLPRMEDCIDNIGSARYVSKLDLLKGYWQVPLTARASNISAFVTPDSFMQYSVMAFGMRNAPATFQRLVNLVLSGVPNAYLDDLVVYSSDWSEHISLLRTVFERLEEASLTLNLAKCEFGQATITYLGKEVGQGQVRPIGAKVTAISEFPAPTTRRELRRFLGMAGYYRSFCRNFSTIAQPLTSLLSPSRKFLWSAECQHAFNSVKDLLCNAPVLAAPDFDSAFKLDVDASYVGVGAVLIQGDKDGRCDWLTHLSVILRAEHQNQSEAVQLDRVTGTQRTAGRVPTTSVRQRV